MHKFRILIVNPDASGLALLTSMLKSLGHPIEEATNDRAAVKQMERHQIDLMLACVDPNDAEALELLTYVRRKHREVPVILLFPQVHPDRAKEALRMGAMSVLKYPVPAAELRAAVMQGLELCELRPQDSAGGAHAGSLSDAGKDSARIAGGAPQNSHPQALRNSGGGLPSVGLADGPPYASHPAGFALQASNSGATLAATSSGMGTGAGSGSAGPRLEQVAREFGLIGNDPSLRQILELAATLAPARSPVLILGEAGTGRSLLARMMHQLGGRGDRPFVTLSCAAIADEMAGLDSHSPPSPDLHAITTEWSTKLVQARGGTLLLDEVAALPSELQLQLLRDLQVRDYEAASGQTMNGNDIRFLMVSGENLPSLVEQGRFRQELYHRISVVSLMLPPLRHRGTDLELLAEHFRARFAQEYRKPIAGFTRDAIDVLHRHDWPGNIREIEGVVQRAVALCSGPRITSSHLAPALHQHRPNRGGSGSTPRPHLPMGIRPLKEALEEPEKKIIIQALQAFNWNRQETARVLDINRTTLYKKMKKYGLLMDDPIWVN
jgi:two-component system response regulator HydG